MWKGWKTCRCHFDLGPTSQHSHLYCRVSPEWGVTHTGYSPGEHWSDDPLQVLATAEVTFLSRWKGFRLSFLQWFQTFPLLRHPSFTSFSQAPGQCTGRSWNWSTWRVSWTAPLVWKGHIGLLWSTTILHRALQTCPLLTKEKFRPDRYDWLQFGTRPLQQVKDCRLEKVEYTFHWGKAPEACLWY